MNTGMKNEEKGNYLMAAACYRQILRYDRSHQQALLKLRQCENMQNSIANKPQSPIRKTPEPQSPIRKTPEPRARNPVTESETIVKSESVSKTKVNELEISSVRCDPEIPDRNRDFKVVVKLVSNSDHEIAMLWLNYKNPDDTGYSQIFTKQIETRFEAIIPKASITGTNLHYFLNGLDKNNLEFFFGSPDEPKSLP